MKLHMVDLIGQYNKIKDEIDGAVLETIASSAYINGPQVSSFSKNLANYHGVRHVIPCANGTDALQIALMALDLKRGDEIIVPAFTYVATAEVIALLGLTPIMVDVDPDHFNLTGELFEKAITPRTKAVVPVHLFGQAAEMEDIMKIASKYDIYVIEDNAQAIGANYQFSDGSVKKAGTIGHIGTTSFFPAKNLGCFGDGGAIFTNDDQLAQKMSMIANHGQTERYYHGMVGVNSRLDSIQAAILDVKLKYLDEYAAARNDAASIYDDAFREISVIQTPHRNPQSSHVFHQYTIRVKEGKREALRKYLTDENIPHNIYYPVPLYEQEAFKHLSGAVEFLPVTDMLCKEVLSLPIHTEMNQEILSYITQKINNFFN
ncbi:MAG TPA: DegT/DnrJ/EryC1/StrS family aminotransferase [Saprospiraceae bacterium]|nr:transcriptional regulator [Saprospirales bacterium]HRQ28884.1 DegT/DnrJ/EryC1/StrS family aminotransferase [Saprospiraceae bacterium]